MSNEIIIFISTIIVAILGVYTSRMDTKRLLRKDSSDISSILVERALTVSKHEFDILRAINDELVEENARLKLARCDKIDCIIRVPNN